MLPPRICDVIAEHVGGYSQFDQLVTDRQTAPKPEKRTSVVLALQHPINEPETRYNAHAERQKRETIDHRSSSRHL